ncbi:MAG: epimerase [Sphingomonas sp.]|nr:MAG: epimerase [Sphingomonas sp.]
MAATPRLLLMIGATGSIGRLVVAQSLRRGWRVRALVRDAARARRLLPAEVELVVGDVTRPDTLGPAVEGADAMVLTVDADGEGKAAAEAVYYGGVRDLLAAIGARRVRIALMTTIGVTDREGHYNRTNEGHDWKRRAERLVRVSSQPYTIVRPGWFDYSRANERCILMLQGDNRRTGTPADGGIAREQIARVLVASLDSDAANRKTFELVAVAGDEQPDLDPLFAMLRPDPAGGPDAVLDIDNQPLSREPDRVRADLQAMRTGSRDGLEG